MPPPTPAARLRSLLFVPGDRPERFPKAAESGADALILDLEDSVGLARKPLARAAVGEWLAARGAGGPACFVRINPLGGLAGEDLDALAGRLAACDGLVLPKAEGAESLAALDAALAARGVAPPPVLPIATETPAAIFRLGSYGEVRGRLLGLTWGAEDLPAALGALSGRDAEGRLTPPCEVARALALFAAGAAEVPAIETVYPAFRDLDGLAAYAARGVRDGFSGMMAIHPAQVEAINRAFTPAPEAVARARAIVAAFAAAPGVGVVNLDGAMVDAPHLKAAERLLARAGEG